MNKYIYIKSENVEFLYERSENDYDIVKLIFCSAYTSDLNSTTYLDSDEILKYDKNITITNIIPEQLRILYCENLD